MKKRRRKITTRLVWGMILFALAITLLITVFISLWVWTTEMAELSQRVVAYAKVASEYIDSESVQRYYTTKEKDSYYNEVTGFLSAEAKHTNLQYYYIFIPEEHQIVYIWDAGIGNEKTEIGDIDPYSSEEEKKLILSEYSSTPSGDATYLGKDEQYGYLLSAYYPILDSNDQPVAMVGVDIDPQELFDSLLTIFMINVTTVGLVTLVMMIIYYISVHFGLIRPIKKLHNATTEMVNHLEDAPSDKQFEVDVHTNDELEDLADAFTQMDHDLKDYVVRLEKVTREKEKISAELNVAAEIQEDMLPRKFPAFPDHREFEIYASMDPAREVGGDFYDFFLVDEDHLCLIIADVSDKGVPASLFMVISKTLLQLRAMLGGTTSEVFYDVNNRLCDGNDAELFVTVWMAIIDLKTGKGIASNAGHEHPTLRRNGGKFELVEYSHSPALAIMPNVKFEEHPFEMHPGDTLFVYTDGAVEATNGQKELFGTGRLVDTLNTVEGTDPKQMVFAVSQAIDDFVKDAPQFDDTTMLAFSYYGPEGRKESEESSESKDA